MQSIKDVAVLMDATIFWRNVTPIPHGKISDALNRRKAILIVVVLVLVLSILITIPSSQTLYILLIFIIFLRQINVHYLSFKHYLFIP